MELFLRMTRQLTKTNIVVKEGKTINTLTNGTSSMYEVINLYNKNRSTHFGFFYNK